MTTALFVRTARLGTIGIGLLLAFGPTASRGQAQDPPPEPEPAPSLRSFAENIDYRDTVAGRRVSAVVEARRLLFEKEAARILREEGLDPAKANPLRDDVAPEVVERMRVLHQRIREEFPDSETEEQIERFLQLADERRARETVGELDLTRRPGEFGPEAIETLQAVAEQYPRTATGQSASRILRSRQAKQALEELDLPIDEDPELRAVFEEQARREFARAMQLVPEQRGREIRDLVEIYEGTDVAARVRERLPAIERRAEAVRRRRSAEAREAEQRARFLRSFWGPVYGRR